MILNSAVNALLSICCPPSCHALFGPRKESPGPLAKTRNYYFLLNGPEVDNPSSVSVKEFTSMILHHGGQQSLAYGLQKIRGTK